MNFPRPKNLRSAPPPRPRPGPHREPPLPLECPLPDRRGTGAALLGLVITVLLLKGELPSTLAQKAAIGTLFSLLASIAFDLKLGGLRNLIRADLMAILSFYFLTFFEFLFPQPNFDKLIATASTFTGIYCVLLGFAGLLVGRHFFHPRQQPFRQTLTREIPALWIVAIFWVCVLVGYIHMLIAVDFDVVLMIDWFMEPRFTQPWQRGRLGNWKALLVELGLFLYLIPPLGGIMIARRQRYGPIALATMSLALLLTLFYGFASGARNVFAAYLVTFLIGYCFAMSFARRKELVALCAGGAVVMVAASYFMLEFRNAGLRNYLEGHYEPPVSQEKTYFVDYNLYNVCRLVEVFPRNHPYLGWEIPFQALIRPIPRAVWKGKPEGLSRSIEDVLGADGWTASASFVGEAYMSGGFWVVALVALGFGALAGWWSHLASPNNSELGILIYASGFFATVISMRSLFVLTTALLPTVAALVIGTYAARLLTGQARRLLARNVNDHAARQRMAIPPRPQRPPPR